MKKLSYFAVVALMAVVGGVAHADDAKMVLNKADGNTSIPVSGITKLTFDGSTMTVATTDGTTQVDVFDLDKITFDLSVSAIVGSSRHRRSRRRTRCESRGRYCNRN